ncbi:MAG: Sulfite exporter TauE/SafE [Rickettsiaceae bacterium]|jgi:uncharacterized membrane protein YfcA|nr:Sulfite exporter TauE/SafE [Rickettsiaceae bacterium]
MFLTLIIILSFSLGFFVESIIGFGAGLIAYAILGFFTDVKQMVIIALYIGTLSSLYIALSDTKYFDKKNFFPKLPLPIIGTIIGTVIFSRIDSLLLGRVLGILLILLSIKTTFFEKFKFPRIFQKKLLLIGGISHGLCGMGGPFIVNALRDDFKHKSNLRSTMAVFFVLFNVIRFIQLDAQDQLNWHLFGQIWWTIFPVLMAIKLGHKAHLAISDELFKKSIALITVLSGVKFLLG